jgi:hypothetical protein
MVTSINIAVAEAKVSEDAAKAKKNKRRTTKIDFDNKNTVN